MSLQASFAISTALVATGFYFQFRESLSSTLKKRYKTIPQPPPLTMLEREYVAFISGPSDMIDFMCQKLRILIREKYLFDIQEKMLAMTTEEAGDMLNYARRLLASRNMYSKWTQKGVQEDKDLFFKEWCNLFQPLLSTMEPKDNNKSTDSKPAPMTMDLLVNFFIQDVQDELDQALNRDLTAFFEANRHNNMAAVFLDKLIENRIINMLASNVKSKDLNKDLHIYKHVHSVLEKLNQEEDK